MLPICVWTAAGQTGSARYGAGELVRMAVEKNRELSAVRQRVAEARGQLKQAGVRPAPSVQIGGATGSPLGSPGREEYSAGYTQPVELGGKRGKRVEAAEQWVAQAEAELAERTLGLATEVKQQYAEAVTEREKLASLEKVIEAYRGSAGLLEARVKEGDAAALDLQLLRVEASRAEAQRSDAAGRVKAAEWELRRLCGLEAGEALALAEPEEARGRRSYAMGELKKLALERRPELALARAEEARSAAEARLAEAQGRPDITISVEYALRNERFGNLYGQTAAGAVAALRDRDNVISGGVSIPLFAKRRNAGNLEAAAARAVGARDRRQYLEVAIPLEVQAAWERWRAAAEALGILEGAVVRQAEKNVEVMQQAYELGQLRLLDVLNERRRLMETQVARAGAEGAARRRWIELERAVGGELK